MTGRLVAAAAYLAVIAAANWAVTQFGVIPVGFGLMAPAGVVFAGLAFTFRDLLQATAGRVWVLTAMTVGALLSAAIATPALALASGLAFGVSELADWVVYEPLRRRRWVLAVAASNVVGIIIDSLIFLSVAFGSLAFLPGQIVGKGWMTLLALAAIVPVRYLRRAEA